MKRRAPSLLLIGLLPFAILPALGAQQRGDPLSSAVDAKGVRHRGIDYVGQVPWMADVIKKQRPEYPYELRARHIGGNGLFRITLDVASGTVSEVAMIQSTGIAALDNSALKALRQWKWKPGKWREIDAPMTFTMSPPSRR
jgi:TonB family protein